MIGGIVGFVLFAIMIPLLVNEAGDLARSLARCLLRWGARRIGRADQARRYEEEWLADLERVPGNLTKLVYACGVVVRSVPPPAGPVPPGTPRSAAARNPAWPHHGRDRRAASRIAGDQRDVAACGRDARPAFRRPLLYRPIRGDALICRVWLHAGGWTPPPGTWKQVGEQIVYPEGHFCQQAMARLDSVIVADLAQDRGDYPPPSAQSYATAKQVGLTSVLSAPLYARGKLLGVMSLALSNLTDRTERHYATADRYLIGAIASQVAVAIDKAMTGRGRAPERPGSSSIAPATSWS